MSKTQATFTVKHTHKAHAMHLLKAVYASAGPAALT